MRLHYLLKHPNQFNLLKTVLIYNKQKNRLRKTSLVCFQETFLHIQHHLLEHQAYIFMEVQDVENHFYLTFFTTI